MRNKEFAVAWLNGEDVQIYDTEYRCWRTLPSPNNVRAMLSFNDDSEYRIKPEVVYKYVNIYPDASGIVGFTGFGYKSEAAALMGSNSTHLLKIGDDGSVELISRQ